jgi:hypothetical protein
MPESLERRGQECGPGEEEFFYFHCWMDFYGTDMRHSGGIQGPC